MKPTVLKSRDVTPCHKAPPGAAQVMHGTHQAKQARQHQNTWGGTTGWHAGALWSRAGQQWTSCHKQFVAIKCRQMRRRSCTARTKRSTKHGSRRTRLKQDTPRTLGHAPLDGRHGQNEGRARQQAGQAAPRRHDTTRNLSRRAAHQGCHRPVPPLATLATLV